jgi:hypothetical protein
VEPKEIERRFVELTNSTVSFVLSVRPSVLKSVAVTTDFLNEI